MGSGGTVSLWPPGCKGKGPTPRVGRGRQVKRGVARRYVALPNVVLQKAWVLYGQAARLISTG